jgi:hypothetical protein
MAELLTWVLQMTIVFIIENKWTVLFVLLSLALIINEFWAYFWNVFIPFLDHPDFWNSFWFWFAASFIFYSALLGYGFLHCYLQYKEVMLSLSLLLYPGPWPTEWQYPGQIIDHTTAGFTGYGWLLPAIWIVFVLTALIGSTALAIHNWVRPVARLRQFMKALLCFWLAGMLVVMYTAMTQVPVNKTTSITPNLNPVIVDMVLDRIPRNVPQVWCPYPQKAYCGPVKTVAGVNGRMEKMLAELHRARTDVSNSKVPGKEEYLSEYLTPLIEEALKIPPHMDRISTMKKNEEEKIIAAQQKALEHEEHLEFALRVRGIYGLPLEHRYKAAIEQHRSPWTVACRLSTEVAEILTPTEERVEVIQSSKNILGWMEGHISNAHVRSEELWYAAVNPIVCMLFARMRDCEARHLLSQSDQDTALDVWSLTYRQEDTATCRNRYFQKFDATEKKVSAWMTNAIQQTCAQAANVEGDLKDTPFNLTLASIHGWSIKMSSLQGFVEEVGRNAREAADRNWTCGRPW